jgi:hypothetical protein
MIMACRILTNKCCVGRHSKLIINGARPTSRAAIRGVTRPVGATTGGRRFIARQSSVIPNEHIRYTDAPTMLNSNVMLNIVFNIPNHFL